MCNLLVIKLSVLILKKNPNKDTTNWRRGLDLRWHQSLGRLRNLIERERSGRSMLSDWTISL